MTSIVMKLVDRTIYDNGEIVYNYLGLLNLLRDGVDLADKLVCDHEEVDQLEAYADLQLQKGPTGAILESSAFQWNTPEPYASRDVFQECLELVGNDEEYRDRCLYEIDQYNKNDLLGMLRHVVYMLDVFRQNEIVWGVGRGSSSASLLLYLVGLHMVDPVEYDIPLSEFIKNSG